MKKFILIIIMLSLFVTGCSYKELNELAIASAIGIDYENGKYKISAQILDLKKSENDKTSTSALIYESEGETIGSAIRNIGLKYPKTLYLGHLELMIIGKGEIEHGINNSFDYFIRTSETRNDALVLISPTNSAYEILNPNEEQNESMPVQDILTTVKNSMDRNGKVVVKNLEEFISDYIETGIDPVATEISLTKQTNKEYKDTTLTGIGVFKENKYFGLLNNTSGIAYNILNNNFYDITLDIKHNNKLVTMGLFNPDSKIDVKLKNNKITVNINTSFEGYVLDFKDSNHITNNSFLNDLEKSTNKVVESYIKELITYSKTNNVDILGLKNMIYKKYYKEYKNYKDKNIYEIADINIKSDIKIYRYGSIHEGFSGGGYE